MADLVVIVPSRGRPTAAVELFEAFAKTRTTAHLVFVVDADDPTHDEYRAAIDCVWTEHHDTESQPSTMVKALNASALRHARGELDALREPPFAIGFMGDDHRPRTVGWDERYLDALREMGTGIVYGNDGLQGANIPTQCAMTSDIVRALGYMAPPELTHLYVDNFWKTLGQGAGCLRYLPDVLIEHMHPIAGKAKWDDGYHRVNAPTMYQRDGQAFREWMATRMTEDIAKVKALRSAAVS